MYITVFSVTSSTQEFLCFQNFSPIGASTFMMRKGHVLTARLAFVEHRNRALNENEFEI